MNDSSDLPLSTLPLDPQAVPLADVVTQALQQVGALATARNVALRSGAIEGAALADPARLRQVLVNLLTNAITRHRGDGAGEVGIDAGVVGQSVRLGVRDGGPALTADRLAELFEPFYRPRTERDGAGGEGSPPERKQGVGIGPVIARELVEGMGGRIDVWSSLGHGTVFEVWLPCAAPLTPTSPTSPAVLPIIPAALLPIIPAALLPVPVALGQLLYIEDNAVNVLLVEELVRSLSGLSIVSEPNGTAGVARAVALRPDLILIDMQLPDFDGFEVLRRLRAAPETASIPCIALSANAMPDDIDRALAAGFRDYWTKPIKFKPFIDALDRLFPNAAANAGRN